MPAPPLLVVEGNAVETRDRLRFLDGTGKGEGYAGLLGRLLPGAVVDICLPTDPGANLPNGTPEEIEAFAVDLETLQHERGNGPLVWRYGIDVAVLDDRLRTAEIANWITHQVPTRARRGRG